MRDTAGVGDVNVVVRVRQGVVCQGEEHVDYRTLGLDVLKHAGRRRGSGGGFIFVVGGSVGRRFY